MALCYMQANIYMYNLKKTYTISGKYLTRVPKPQKEVPKRNSSAMNGKGCGESVRASLRRSITIGRTQWRPWSGS